MGKGPAEAEMIIPDEDIEYFEWQKFSVDSAMHKTLDAVCKIK